MLCKHLVASLSEGSARLCSHSSWQQLMALKPPASAYINQSNDDNPGGGKRHKICEIDSVHLSLEPWLRSCVFLAYSVYDEASVLLKQGRIALVLTPPHLESGATVAAEGHLPWAFGSCNTCSPPIRRLGALLDAWSWPAVTVVGRSWRTLMDVSQQQSKAVLFRSDIMDLLSGLESA